MLFSTSGLPVIHHLGVPATVALSNGIHPANGAPPISGIKERV
jgi:hypothetical protein